MCSFFSIALSIRHSSTARQSATAVDVGREVCVFFVSFVFFCLPFHRIFRQTIRWEDEIQRVFFYVAKTTILFPATVCRRFVYTISHETCGKWTDILLCVTKNRKHAASTDMSRILRMRTPISEHALFLFFFFSSAPFSGLAAVSIVKNAKISVTEASIRDKNNEGKYSSV